MQKKYIGNIVTSYDKSKFPQFFNIIKRFDEKIDNLPTLIIGLNEAKEHIDNFSIIKKQYSDNLLWWTYRKTERKYEYDNDIEKYYDFCLRNFLSDVVYFYLDIGRYRYKNIKKLLQWINSPTEKLCFLTRDSNFLFIYDTSMKIVFGLSLTLCEYMGINRKKVVRKVKHNRKNIFIYNTDFINSEIRQIIGNNTHYILPLASIFG